MHKKFSESFSDTFQIYLGNNTDTLVQNIQALVSSIRSDEKMPIIRDHTNGILDIVEVILAAVEGAMEEPSSFQDTFTEQVAPAYESLSKCKSQLEQAVVDSMRHEGKPSAKNYTQGLPPLVFQTAREAKELTARAEEVTYGSRNGDAEDFS